MDSVDWIFGEGDIQVSDTVVGRGAFGEVKVGNWRSIQIACKTLHAVSNDNSSVSENIATEFTKEIAMLSKLRHPNLVLFLGIVVKDVAAAVAAYAPPPPAPVIVAPSPQRTGSRNRSRSASPTTLDSALINALTIAAPPPVSAALIQPLMILTELMTCSLYDILEVYKHRLSLPEVLDISIDIVNGLEYLHFHNPTIVHRDISSKNILIGGNKAKIADLGQAKFFGSAANSMSRQTGMPGAMAYAAPEVLTGKYSAKLDIFSFGILLIQMCTGEYPRIDRREEQLQSAINVYPILRDVITMTCSYIPGERPDAKSLGQMLIVITANDRYYPPQRRVVPQSDISVLARRWLEANIQDQCLETNLKLEQNVKLLKIEGERWQLENQRANAAEAELVQLRNRFMATETCLLDQIQISRASAAKIEELEGIIAVQKGEIVEAQSAISSLTRTVQSMEQELKAKDEILNSTMIHLINTQSSLEQSTAQLEQCTIQLSDEMMAREQEQKLVRVHEGTNEELEERLDRALVGWKIEKDNYRKLHEEKLKQVQATAKMTQQCRVLEEEIADLNTRLSAYITLPLPDEIRERFRVLESDLATANRNIKHLTEIKHSLEQELSLSKDKNESLEHKVEHLSQRLHEHSFEVNSLKHELQSSVDLCGVQHTELVHLRQIMATITAERDKLAEHEKRLKEKVEELENRIILEAERTQMLVAKAAAGAAEIGLTQASYEAEQAKIERKEKIANMGTGGLPPSALLANDGAATEIKEEILVLTDAEYLEVDSAAKRQVRAIEDHEGHIGLINFMKQNMLNYCVCWRVSRALRERVVKDDAIRMSCLSNQVDDMMISTILRFPTNAIVLSQAFRLLGALAYGNDIVRRRAGERRIMTAIIAALEEHADDENVLLHACTALTNLLHNSLENRHRFVEGGGIQILVGQMDRYRQSSKIQRQACWAILTLAGSDDVARAVAMGGACSAVLNAMTEHRLDAGVQQFGAWAISNMAIAGDDVRRKLKKAGAMEVCKIAIETFKDDEEVIKQARHALGVLGPR